MAQTEEKCFHEEKGRLTTTTDDGNAMDGLFANHCSD